MEALDALIRSHALPAAYRQMVDRVHRPAAERIAEVRRALGRPIVAGLCGSQGSGKSTMAAFLKALLESRGLKTAVLSIDDLYLTLPERERLAAEVHPLLRTRGVPGTHDVGLGHALLDVLSDGVAEVSMPRFDKAQDTRAPAGTWPRLTSPMDVILLEGWCVGAIPQTEAALAAPVNALERDEDAGGVWRRYVNDRLMGDYAGLFGRIDVLALLAAPSFAAVYGWRLLQEQKLAETVRRERLTGTRLMDERQIRRFLMFYQRLTEWILEEMPGRADILMPLDEHHRILGVEFREARP
jgi:D-glycerate 3-kinase